MKQNTILEIDLGVIKNNVEVLRSYLKPDVQQMAVVKAEAYGHGATEVAHAISSIVEWFAVNDINEAVELRKNGIENPILVFGVPNEGEADLYPQYNITATISNGNHFKMLAKGTEYHLNFDTGMGRLGFHSGQVEEVLELQKNHSELKCTGIYSHFATADELNSEKGEKQVQEFEQIRTKFGTNLVTHMSNTAGLMQYPDAQYDLVRVGIGIYGYAPGQISLPGLTPAMSWKTHLVQVNSIEKGETASYGATWSAPEDGFLGIIPVGYADGIPRGLSGKFSVSIEDEIYPVVGTVTMNYCMINLGQKMFDVGTDVYLWDEHQTASDWARIMDTIPYEMLTNASSKIVRKYSGR